MEYYLMITLLSTMDKNVINKSGGSGLYIKNTSHNTLLESIITENSSASECYEKCSEK